MHRSVSIPALGWSVACLMACASPGKSMTQTVRIETPACMRASCTLSNDQGAWRVDATPGDASVMASCAPLRVVCKSSEGPENSAGASSSLSAMDGVGALAGGAAGGAAVGVVFGSVALAFIPVLGIALVASGVALGAAGGSALESGQQTLAYPPVISVAMSCMDRTDAAAMPQAGRVGVGFRGLSLAEVQAQGSGEHGAVVVTDVGAGSVAGVAGLRSGDLVLAANGHEIIDAAQLEQLALTLAAGSSLRLRLWRDGHFVEISLVVP